MIASELTPHLPSDDDHCAADIKAFRLTNRRHAVIGGEFLARSKLVICQPHSFDSLRSIIDHAIISKSVAEIVYEADLVEEGIPLGSYLAERVVPGNTWHDYVQILEGEGISPEVTELLPNFTTLDQIESRDFRTSIIRPLQKKGIKLVTREVTEAARNHQKATESQMVWPFPSLI